ncbi:MAG: OmpA/MotB domain protein [Fluviicola sp.]|jgi:chemotaxis protein MotB|uniref:OmpA/MotB family protein n=1 Tax=Fluviicola sp. TaxID=1917219 RepID=UPI00260678AD|nr:OmpA family protein [Fluviicola sp.]MDF3027586.1 OmpA/MotB domain protein [Fluviicola sp.]
MKKQLSIIALTCALAACVPAKKYNELLEKEKICSEELNKYKTSSIENEGKAKDLQVMADQFRKDIISLKKDTLELGSNLRFLQTQYDLMVSQNEVYEQKLDQMRMKGAKESANYQADIDAKNLELQRKEDALKTLESELIAKEKLLIEREERVTELEEMIKRKDDAMKQLKTRVSTALKGFENKGLTVVEKNGKIYVSLEAKLLFASGSTVVEPDGKKALVDLAKVLENEKDLEIIVEGHTDTDKLASASHPKNNWELSVLRSTSVVEIMIGNSKMNPMQLMAAGRGEYHPVDVKDKAKNRRIEVIISPNLNELYQILDGK